MEELPSLENVAFASTSNYTIRKELGRGGMGVVYLAERNSEGVIDNVVLKTIKTIDPTQIQNLRNEANIATFLRHENIVKTYGLESIPIQQLPPSFHEKLVSIKTSKNEKFHTGKLYRPKLIPPKNSFADRKKQFLQKKTTRELREDEKLFCMAMDYVEGTDLGHLHWAHIKADLLLPPIFCAFVISRICRALGYAHQFIVHRDISPENIMINDHGVAKLTDFGIAVASGKKTEFAGKIMYMSPEQVMGKKLDGRSDIFSLGLVCFYILTGINLLAKPNDMTLVEYINYAVRAMANGFPKPHEVRDDIPIELSEIVAKMLEVDVNKRYQSAIEVGDDLEKKYLYAKGFGPTNNSLAAYIDILKNNFKNVTQNNLKQLTFLADQNNKIVLHRLFSFDTYTEFGKEIIKNTQKKQLMYRTLKKRAEKTGENFS